jgi:hypothetical protein
MLSDRNAHSAAGPTEGEMLGPFHIPGVDTEEWAI